MYARRSGFSPSGALQLFVTGGVSLSVYGRSGGGTQWHRSEQLHVPIAYGSSS